MGFSRQEYWLWYLALIAQMLAEGKQFASFFLPLQIEVILFTMAMSEAECSQQWLRVDKYEFLANSLEVLKHKHT